MKLLINNTEQEQRRESNETVFKLFGRHPDNPERREVVTVHGFRPYFYAPAGEARSMEDWLLSQDCIEELDYEHGFDGFNVDYDIVRVYVPTPQATRDARELFDGQTFEADVQFTNRLRVDTGLKAVVEVPGNDVHYTEIKPVEPDVTPPEGGVNGSKTPFQNLSPRVVTLDIEVDDRGAGFPEHGEERILSIVAHDSYDDETVAWLDGGGRELYDWAGVERPDEDEDPKEVLGIDDAVDQLHLQTDERAMLIDFACWIDDKDPDLLTGWNIDGFDGQYLIARMEEVGAQPNRMSPLGWSGINNFGDARIKGRTIYDLLDVYKANQFTEKSSYRLDAVAHDELGERKIDFTGTYYDLYENDPMKFIQYNARDVELCVRINEEADVIQFRDLLRRQVGVDFEDSFNNKDFVDMMCRRKLYEWRRAGPTRPSWQDTPESDFEGAAVLDAFSGVAENVAGMDLASLYPYLMAMLNASPETKSDDGLYVAASGTRFSSQRQGLFPALVDDGIELKATYKTALRNATDEDTVEFLENQYGVAKTVTNSLYGVTGWPRFFLYDEDVAEAVTLTGQEIIRATANFVENEGFEAIYGDTDSVYVKMPSTHGKEWCLEQAQVLAARLNNKVYPRVVSQYGVPEDECLMEIEVETYMERYFQWGKKKQYAYLATWKDGHDVEDPSVTIVGSSSRRSDRAALTQQVERDIMQTILRDEGSVGDVVFQAAKKIDRLDPEWELIGIPMGYGQEFSEYDNPGAHVRGGMVANEALGKDYGKGDKPMRCYIEDTTIGGAIEEPTDVICYEVEGDLEPGEGYLKCDVTRMTQKLLINPFDEMLAAIDVDVAAAIRGQQQTGLGAWE